MNTGEMMLTLGAMVLLSLLILRMNNVMLSSEDAIFNSKFSIVATSIASSIIEEASGKAFDENTISGFTGGLNNLTPSGQLGPESGESYPVFNDFDDYNNLQLQDTTKSSAVFNVSCKVTYIDPLTPDIKTGSRTWNKKITVTVSSVSMKDTMQISSIFSYWVFR